MNTKEQAIAQLRYALQKFAITLDDEGAMEIAEVYPKWTGEAHAYKVNDICGYGYNTVGDTQLYRCLQAHISQEDWTPDVAVSLFKAIGITPSGYPEWSQPVGAEDAYNKGDIVSYNEKIYISDINANVWAPDVYGWSEKQE